MNCWLSPVVAALAHHERRALPCPVFFRDDDAGWDDAALYALLDVFETSGVAVDVAVGRRRRGESRRLSAPPRDGVTTGGVSHCYRASIVVVGAWRAS